MGVDISDTMMEAANARFDKYSTDTLSYQFEIGNALDLSDKYNNKYDIALAFWLLNYAQDKNELEKMHKSLFKVLKPGGIAIGTTALSYNKDGIPFDYKEFNRKHKETCGIFYDMSPTHKLVYDIIFANVQNKDGSDFKIRSRYYSFDTYNDIAKKAGFNDGIEPLDIKLPSKHIIDNPYSPTEVRTIHEYFGHNQPLAAFRFCKNLCKNNA